MGEKKAYKARNPGEVRKNLNPIKVRKLLITLQKDVADIEDTLMQLRVEYATIH